MYSLYTAYAQYNIEKMSLRSPSTLFSHFLCCSSPSVASLLSFSSSMKTVKMDIDHTKKSSYDSPLRGRVSDEEVNQCMLNGNRDQGSPHDYSNQKLNDHSDQESGMGFRNGSDFLWSKTYLVTRTTLGFLNLISLCLKTPLLIFLLRMVIEVLVAKKEEARVTTIEPPYEEDLQPANPIADEAAVKAQRRAMMIETGSLLVIYVGMLLIHLMCAFAFWLNKGLFHVIFYLPVVFTWLFFSITSYFVQEWKYPLSFVFLIFKAFIHGNELFGPPDRMELALIRVSFWFDGVTFLLTIGFLVMTCKLAKDLKRETIRCRPYYDLLKLL